MKNSLIIAGVILLAGLLIFAFIGVKHTFSAKPPPAVIHTTDTLRLTQEQLDSADAVWQKRFMVIKKGSSISKGKTDTVTTTYEDTSTIAGLYSLLDEITQQQNAHQCPVYAQPQPQAQGYKLGMAFGVGTGLNKHSTKLKLGPAIGGEKGVISLSVGYSHWDDDKWRGDLSYIRWFR